MSVFRLHLLGSLILIKAAALKVGNLLVQPRTRNRMKEARIRVKICRGEELIYERKTKSSYFAFLGTNYQASATAFLRVPSLIYVALLVRAAIPSLVRMLLELVRQHQAAQKPYSSIGVGLVLRGSNSKWYQAFKAAAKSAIYLEGGGTKKGILGNVGRFGMVGIEGIGGKETLGMLGSVGMVGIVGIVGMENSKDNHANVAGRRHG
ncbi:hypothetical protein Tco_0480548 [Tanacetum coccineum]